MTKNLLDWLNKERQKLLILQKNFVQIFKLIKELKFAAIQEKRKGGKFKNKN